MEEDIKYPVGIQSFSEIITGGYVYVDKTMYVRKMIDSGKYYFLSRPRRFGKSLFLSTLESYFEGRRDLFKGLALDSDGIDWTPRPVIKFSFNAVRAKEKGSLDKYLETTLSEYEEKYAILSRGDYSDRFAILIRRAKEKTGQKVAILVDEYDSVLLDTMGAELSDLNNYYRQTLKSIFSVLKNEDANIYLAFITGISRFSHTSLFSGANHLKDISMLEEYDSICGITEAELHTILLPGVKCFAEKLKKSPTDVLALLKENYDGYHFSETCTDIFNPFSLLQALDNKKISNYWFTSGTPSYLIDILKKDDFFMPSLDCIETVESDLSVKESYLQNPVSLLFESGYVTIKGYEEETEIYTLGLPNLEVAKSFTEALLPIFLDLIKERPTNSSSRYAVMSLMESQNNSWKN